jgi:hypothetical protein
MKGHKPMSLPIVTADQRLSEQRGIKGCIFGKSGIGKTSLLWTLPAEKTLFIDLEAGDLAIEGWSGNILRPRTWQECRDYAVFIGGANPALRDELPYSKKHFEAVCKNFGDPKDLDKYETIFIDSITAAARLCFRWCQGEPQAFNASGKPNLLGAYGLHAQEMIGWITHLQYTRDKNVWFVGILDEKTDEFKRKFYEPQIEGSKTALELPGIVDQVITMAERINKQDSYGRTIESSRVFVCQTLNPDGYPAKDRSGRLECMETPHLGQLMEKIRSKKAASWQLTYNIPTKQ